jgi:hypothetical protein
MGIDNIGHCCFFRPLAFVLYARNHSSGKPDDASLSCGMQQHSSNLGNWPMALRVGRPSRSEFVNRDIHLQAVTLGRLRYVNRAMTSK